MKTRKVVARYAPSLLGDELTLLAQGNGAAYRASSASAPLDIYLVGTASAPTTRWAKLPS